jgi:hypothetical protein
VKRPLGGFRERGEQDQTRDYRIERAGDDGSAAGHHRRQVRRPCHVDEQEAGREQRQAARPGDDQCLYRGSARVVALVFEANEQERREARELPEYEQREDVVAERHAEHGPHEREQPRVEAAGVGMAVEVSARIQNDERTDSGDEQGKQQAQAIEVERQRQAE